MLFFKTTQKTPVPFQTITGSAQVADGEEQLSGYTDKLESVYAERQPRISEMADELISISRDTEDEFLAVGVNLQSFSNGCIENSSSASSIVTMMEDGSGLNINAFKELFEHAHNKVESCAAAISQGIRGMTGLMSKIDNVSDLSIFLKKLSRSISILGTLMRIETARVGEDEFNIMTAVIDELAGEIEKDNNEIASSAKSARNSLIASKEKMTSEVKGFNKDLEINRKHVHETLDDMNRMITKSKSACQRIEGRASQISPEVGKVVSAIQYHDICRQQMEHISEVLKNISSKISQMDTMSADEKAAFNRAAADALRIQISQIEHVISETGTSAEDIISHLSQISDLAVAQAEEAEMIVERDESGSSRIEKIVSRLKSMSEMLSATKTMIAGMTEAVSGVNAHIGEMSRQVLNINEISESINLLALNTIVKVARTGEAGRGLEVLAGEIRKLSNSSKREIEKGAEAINSILTASAAFEKSLSEELDKELSSTDAILAQTYASVEALLNADKEVKKALNKVSGDTKNLETDIMRIVSDIKFDDIIKSRLGKMASALQAMLRELGENIPSVTGDTITALSPELHDLTARYTMHSERKVHEAVLSSGREGDNGTSAGRSKAKDNNLGDNVELF